MSIMNTMKERKKFWYLMLVSLICGILFNCSPHVLATEKPIIFPIPQQLQLTQERFAVDETVSILLPENACEEDVFLARFLVRELSDKYGVAIKIK